MYWLTLDNDVFTQGKNKNKIKDQILHLFYLLLTWQLKTNKQKQS